MLEQRGQVVDKIEDAFVGSVDRGGRLESRNTWCESGLGSDRSGLVGSVILGISYLDPVPVCQDF